MVIGPRIARRLLSMAHLRRYALSVVTSNLTYSSFAFCVKCKEKRDFEGTMFHSGGGRGFIVGTCPECGSDLTRIASMVDVAKDTLEFNDDSLWDE